ncbi:hypothetical protein IM40_09470 (plasmid) [Candidatus Paracaedimonas acanthamoebae]|nr:hypothetical protein IM40_09470 [Candidatus Paracaedimonas acanthamoebae]
MGAPHSDNTTKRKTLIKFKPPRGAQRLLSLIGKIKNLFSVEVGRYKKKASDQRLAFAAAKAIWLKAALGILAA